MGLDRRTTLGLAALAAAAPSLVHAQPASTPIRLNANENPLGPSPKAVAAAIKAVETDAFRYPDAYSRALTADLAAHEGVKPENIVLASGSAEILTMAGAAFGLGGKQIVCADPTFFILPNYARLMGAQVQPLPLTKDHQHDLSAMAAALGSNAGLVYVCNPNNPTGTLTDADALRTFTRKVSAQVPVLIDECYIEITDDPARQSMLDLVRSGAPVLISKTFSKVHALAGMRVGYAITTPELAQRLARYRMSILNVPGLAAARASLADTAFIKRSHDGIAAGRAQIYAILDRLGRPYLKSHANFVLFDAGRPATEIGKAMAAKGVLINDRTTAMPTWVRVSTGLKADLDAFGAALKEIV